MDISSVKSLAQEATKTLGSKKPITLVKEDVVLADGTHFVPMEVKTSSDVLRVSLLMLFKHIADIHVCVVNAVADKFGLKIEDIHKAVTEDPRWAEMFVHPLITDLTKTLDENSIAPPPPPPPPKQKKPRKPRAKKQTKDTKDTKALLFKEEDYVVNEKGEIVF